MSTWTELLGRATPDSPRDVDVSPAELRELLLDLPQHPHAGAVRSVTVEVNAGMLVRLRLPCDESMAPGSSGTMETGAAVRTRASAPLVYAPERDGEHGREALREALREGAENRLSASPEYLAKGEPWPGAARAHPTLDASRPKALAGVTNAEVRAILGPLAPVWARDVATVAPKDTVKMATTGAAWLAGIEYEGES